MYRQKIEYMTLIMIAFFDIGLILLWRKLHSALKTLIQPLDNCKVWCEERSMYRIYSTCSIHTATGRITMHEPNLQTIRKDFSLELEGN